MRNSTLHRQRLPAACLVKFQAQRHPESFRWLCGCSSRKQRERQTRRRRFGGCQQDRSRISNQGSIFVTQKNEKTCIIGWLEHEGRVNSRPVSPRGRSQ